MKRIVIVVVIALFLGISLSSCGSRKKLGCPAYGQADKAEQVEQKV